MDLEREGLLQEGEILQTVGGELVKVGKMLGSGGQGEVYKVQYKGQEKALKWYTELGQNPEAFRKNLEENIKKGSPDRHFLWPQDLTEWKNGSFGYLMELFPEGYYELTYFLNGKVHFDSWKTAVDAALNVVMAFRLLHNEGRSYQDLNDGNFFIHPFHGDVFIGDTDNIAPSGENMGIVGKPRYIAPEIVRGDTLPNTASDRYSLAMLLFMIFCYGHPLEGKTGTPYVMTPLKSMKIYGTHPVFVYDQEDDSNRPITGLHNTVITLWNCLPSYMKDAFIAAFSQDSLMKKRRLTEYDWLKVLVRFRSDIVTCTCKNEVFLQNGSSTSCDCCGKMYEIRDKIVFSEYAMPALKGTRIYRMQLGTVNFKDALNPVATVLANPKNPADIRIRNISGEKWKCTTPSGKTKIVENKEMVPVKKGIRVQVYDTEFQIQ